MDPFFGVRPATAPFGPRTMAPRLGAAGAPTAVPFAASTATAPARTALTMRSQPSQTLTATDPLEAAYRFLAADSALAAAEILDTPWPGTWGEPVAKDILVGPRGGPFYIKTHPDGSETKVYLKKKQRQDCKDGVLIGAGTTCPAANITGYRERGTTHAEKAARTAVTFMGVRQERQQQRWGRAPS
ncbi:hypothetical protein pqer_cds_370 [Pandoravirus quercus]|uniref:Uncharacterized protein n=1 Tax=Pandoravirus quercus TaxID=2107709 RepID=A0A2U7U8T1_9VIRU|nr:hypothetical protein pqer_cds_370 [Pandoravirus quercus]AVK74792.1 hypothetical protein pqer_cds_370 [Pandoravirus quercus]